MPRVLVLGGTTEASDLARALATAGVDAVFSYAGRTEAPVAQPIPVRVGGFGGVDGLVRYLTTERISHLVDATHPFAAQMSRNAVAASGVAGVPLIAFERPAWEAGPGDDWRAVQGIEGAVNALPDAPARVFLAIGRQHLIPFAARPQHFYLLRLVDAMDPLPLPHAKAIIARGPFDEVGDRSLMQAHRITYLVAKNAGGRGARAKMDAARALGVPVILIDRPVLPDRQVAGSVEGVMDWLHHADLGV